MSDQAENRVSADIKEFQFPQTPLGRVRAALHAFAGKWALRATVQQQNAINHSLNHGQDGLKASLRQIDQELVQQQKQIGELTALVANLNHQLDELQNELKSKE